MNRAGAGVVSGSIEPVLLRHARLKIRQKIRFKSLLTDDVLQKEYFP
jgi:hypothetical protein